MGDDRGDVHADESDAATDGAGAEEAVQQEAVQPREAVEPPEPREAVDGQQEQAETAGPPAAPSRRNLRGQRPSTAFFSPEGSQMVSSDITIPVVPKTTRKRRRSIPSALEHHEATMRNCRYAVLLSEKEELCSDLEERNTALMAQIESMKKEQEQASRVHQMRMDTFICCSICFHDSPTSLVRCMDGHPLCMSCCSTCLHDEHQLVCAVDGCAKDIHVPEPMLLPILLKKEEGMQSTSLATFRRALVHAPLIEKTVNRSVDARLEGKVSLPWHKRPCCGRDMPNEFVDCCAITCNECQGSFCAVCLKEFYSTEKDVISEGLVRLQGEQVWESTNHSLIHAHVVECFRGLGLGDSYFVSMPNWARERKMEHITRVWSLSILRHYAHKIHENDDTLVSSLMQQADGVSNEALSAILQMIGYPKQVSVWAG